MRRAFRQPLAVAFALLVVTAAALSGAFVFNDDVHTLEGASNQYVQRGEAAIGTAIVAGTIGLAVGTYAYTKFADSPASAEELNASDWRETHLNIYQSAINQKGSADAFLSTEENYLQDTKPIALMKGKKAYIAELQHAEQSSLGDAEVAAFSAVDDYYATKQQNLVSAWNMQVTTIGNGLVRVNNQSGVSQADVFAGGGGSQVYSVGNTTVTLVDGSSVTAKKYKHAAQPTASQTVTGPKSVYVKPPSDSELTRRQIVEGGRWGSAWSSIESQSSAVKDELKTFINATYSEYQAGEIEAKDFADPYLGARNSPEGSQAWSMLSLASMGIAPPMNTSQVQQMEVSANGSTETGMLLSDGTPASGGFSPGETYNADSLSGSQLLLTQDGEVRELSGQFTLGNVTRPDGSRVGANETLRYPETNYSTANLTELQSLNDQMNELQAQINARQQKLRNSGGGAGWLPNLGGLDLGRVAPVVVIAGGALVLLARN